MIPESRETRTPHPQQSKMVNFSVKAGYGGRLRPIKGMEALHFTVKTFDTNQTWEEAFLEGYGLKIDTQRYSIRRSRGPKGTAPQHSLQTKIREILGEYLKSQQSLYGVTIVVNSAFAESSPTKEASDTLTNECEMPQEITSVVNGTRYNRASTSAAANNDHSRHRSYENAGHSVVRDFLFRAGREEASPPPPKLTKMTNYDEESDSDSDEYDYATNGHLKMRTPKIVNVVSQYKNISSGNRQVQYEEAAIDIPGHNNGQYSFDCAASVCSQDSQFECLEEGIEYDNTYKDKIGLRLRKRFTPGQFARFRDALKELKDDKSGKLMRFAEKQPLLVSFLRELFEI